MAFPSIAAVQTSGGSSAPSVSVALPAGITAGNLLIALIHCSNSASFTWPAGWNELYDQSGGAAGQTAAWRLADGSEGASVVATANSGTAVTAHLAMRITGAHPSTPPEIGTPPAVASTTTPNPPSLTPSWGQADTLWIATAGTDAIRTVSAYPGNYTLNQNSISENGSLTDETGAVAARQLNAASEDPGTFTFSGGGNVTAQTIAVRPVPAAFPFNPNPFLSLLVR